MGRVKSVNGLGQLDVLYTALGQVELANSTTLLMDAQRTLDSLLRDLMRPITSLPLTPAWASSLSQITSVTQHLGDLGTESLRLAGGRIALDSVHGSWLAAFASASAGVEGIQTVLAKTFSGMRVDLAAAAALVTSTNLHIPEVCLRLPSTEWKALDRAMRGTISSYASLGASFANVTDVARLPSLVLPGASRELLATSLAYRSLGHVGPTECSADVEKRRIMSGLEEEVAPCVELLQAVEPALVELHRGARDALAGGRADRARHVLSSLRELWNHLLRHIAPDSAVLAWAKGRSADLVDKGRPTRAARVMYVCRGLNHPPLSEFVLKDTRALVSLIDFCNRVHDLTPGLTDEDLHAVVVRTDSWLVYLLEIWNGGHRA